MNITFFYVKALSWHYGSMYCGAVGVLVVRADGSEVRFVLAGDEHL